MRTPLAIVTALTLFAPITTASADPMTDAYIGAHERCLIEMDQPAGGAFVAPFEFEGERYTLVLKEHSVRAPGFRVLVDDGTGVLKETPPAPVSTYRGQVLELPGSSVTALRTAAGLTARVVRAGHDDAWAIQPASDFEAGRPAHEHIVYSSADLLPMPFGCNAILMQDDRPIVGNTPKAARGGTLKVAQIGWDVDYEAFLELGSVGAATTKVEGIILDVNTIYERDVSVRHEIVEIVVRTSAATNPYTSNLDSVLLPEISSEWLSAPLNTVERDLVHLLTGRDINNNNVIGVAYVDRTCSQTSGIGASENLSNTLTQTGLVAHELGHNWSARHCNGDGDCRIMCSSIGGCDGLGTPNFGPVAIASITNKRDSVDCLHDASNCVADFDNDGDVDLGDFGVFGAAFNSMTGDANYDPAADFDNDGDVDLGDFGVFGAEFGQTGC